MTRKEWAAEQYDEVFKDWHHKRCHLRYINPILNLVPDDKALRIVDIGCGVGTVLAELEKRGYSDLTGCDFSKVAIERTKQVTKSVKLYVVDIRKADFRDYDLAILTEVLEHLENDRLMLPAKWIASVPNGHTVAKNHVREYTPDIVRERYGADIFEVNESNIIFGKL